jgi:UDP-glucuronate 4-epimerase
VKVLLYPPAQPPVPPALSQSNGPFRIFNIGHNRPVEVVLFVRMLEELLGKKAVVELVPPQPGDMIETCANIGRLRDAIGFSPKTSLEDGLKHFVEWFRGYYKL